MGINTDVFVEDDNSMQSEGGESQAESEVEVINVEDTESESGGEEENLDSDIEIIDVDDDQSESEGENESEMDIDIIDEARTPDSSYSSINSPLNRGTPDSARDYFVDEFGDLRRRHTPETVSTIENLSCVHNTTNCSTIHALGTHRQVSYESTTQYSPSSPTYSPPRDYSAPILIPTSPTPSYLRSIYSPQFISPSPSPVRDYIPLNALTDHVYCIPTTDQPLNLSIQPPSPPPYSPNSTPSPLNIPYIELDSDEESAIAPLFNENPEINIPPQENVIVAEQLQQPASVTTRDATTQTEEVMFEFDIEDFCDFKETDL